MGRAAEVAVWLFALGQTLIYAGCFYAFPALLPQIEADTGWTKAQLALGPTLAFLTMAAMTPLTGRLVDRGRGGWLMTLCPAVIAAGVLTLSQAQSLWVWWGAWAVIGVAQAGCLYETCFALLTRRLEAPRSAITKVTLVAGFAGTLAFPLGHWMGAAPGGGGLGLGGQGALAVFALLVLAGVPLHAAAVALLARGQARRAAPAPTPPGTIGLTLRKPAFWIISAIFGLIWLNHGMLLTYALPLFAERGAGAGLAAAAAASIGPAQVVGRLAFLAGEARIGNALAARAALVAIAAAAACLWLAGATPLLIFGFALLQGAGAGLLSILRPMLIVDALGRQGFGAVSGAVAVSPILATAAAPSLGAGLLALGGAPLVIGACLVMAVAGLALLWRLTARE